MAESSSSPPPKDNPLRANIRHLVTTTNAALSTVQSTAQARTAQLTSRLSALSHQARLVATRAVSAYDHRGYYGPQICVGSALILGGKSWLRRGRGTGGLAAVLGGALAYENVYGFNVGGGGGWRERLLTRDDGAAISGGGGANQGLRERDQ